MNKWSLINFTLLFASLFHELQGQASGFLSHSLYLFHSSAVIGVPTVSVDSRQLHALCFRDGLCQSERPWFWMQDTSYKKKQTIDQQELRRWGSAGVSLFVYLSHCHSQVSARRATVDLLSEVSFWAVPEYRDDPIKLGRAPVFLTGLHSALPKNTHNHKLV